MWKEYNNARKDGKPNPLLVEVVENAKYALDLGAGSLVDSKLLVSKGYEVDAVDCEPSFVEYVVPGITPFVSKFDEFEFPVGKYDLVNANFSLPFNSPTSFDDVFARLTRSLKPGGTFIGQFFGPEDDWANNKKMTFHSEEEVKILLAQFSRYTLKEIKKEDTLALGGIKKWHYFDVIAVR